MLEKLEVDFAKQGYFVTFALTTRNENAIKAVFPNAKPIHMLSIGYKDVKDSLEPYKEQLMNYLLPLLTGLKPEELKKIQEIRIFHRPKEQDFLKIVTPYSYVEA